MKNNLNIRATWILVTAIFLLVALAVSTGLVVTVRHAAHPQPFLWLLVAFNSLLLAVAFSVDLLSKVLTRRFAEQKNLNARKYSRFGVIGLIRAMLAKPVPAEPTATRGAT